MMLALTDKTFDKYLADGMPLLVMFHAAYAGPCNLAKPEFEGAARRIGNRIRCATFDLDGNPDVPERYGVRGVPLFILFKGGQPADAYIGALTEAKLLEVFDAD